MTSLLTKIKSLDSQVLTNTQNISNKQNNITDGSLTISKTLNLQSSLNTLQDNIDLNTANILNKQNTITSSTNLTCNSLTTNHLEVNNIISTSQFFDTIVVRRPTAINGIGSDRIGVKELQCWVNGVNIMIDNGLTSYFASWLDKDTDVGPQNVGTLPTLAYNNSIDDLGALSSSSQGLNSAFIIKNIPYTPIHNIQAIVFYSRDANDTLQTAVGIGIELYNSTNDPNLTTSLASTPVITSVVVLVYRYDFPSIDTYTDFVGENSITNIVNNTFAFPQDADLISYTEITGDVIMKGDLTAENLIVGSTNIITEINTKQNIINDNDLSISKTLNLQSSLTNLQDNINLKQNILTSGTNITIDENNVISSSGGSITQGDLDLKQDKLTAGTNITIDANNNISSTGGITQSQLDTKQNILNDVSTNTIQAYSAEFLNLKMPSGIFTYNGITLDSLISAKQTIFKTLENQTNNLLDVYRANINGGASKLYFGATTLQILLDTKQQLITTVSDLTLRTLTCNSIVIDGTNFNVMLTELETTLDKTARTNTDNIFLGLQTINNNLNVDYVKVKYTTPLLSTHLTSKLYVDTALNTKQNTLSLSSNITTGTISSSNITGIPGSTITFPNISSTSNLYYDNNINVKTKILNIETSLNSKQATLIAGDNITIINNRISSTSGNDITQEDLDLKENKLSRNSHLNISSLIISDDAFSINTIVPGQVKSDTLETGDITANSLILNATGGVNSLTANSLATFEAVRIDTELMCHANDIYFGIGLVSNPATIRNRINFFTPNNNAGWVGMRFGLEQDTNGEKVARMRLDNSSLGEINKYNIMIGSVSTMNIDINKTTFYQSLDVVSEITCNSLVVNGVNITSSTGSTITQADLDTKQPTLTSSTDILTKRIDVADKLVITNTQPTLYLKDTNNRSGMIHMNSDRMYFLSGENNTESWTAVNGRWPLYLQTNTNEAVFGGNISAPGEVAGTILKVNMGDSKYWDLNSYNDQNLGFYQNKILKGYIEDDGGQLVNRMNFTGQHRCFIKDIPYSNINYIGRIVCANQNTYISMSNTIKKGNQAIIQNESLPYVSISNKMNDKSCFGVISSGEDPNERIDRYGAFSTPYEKEKGDTRIYINSVGEGAIWITNKNGTLEAGDYITTCDLSGYGIKQSDDFLHNYTVAKITMDCDFNPKYVPKPTILKDENGENILDLYDQLQWTNEMDVSGNIVYEYEYNIRYINDKALDITYEEYIENLNNSYIVAYVGCTYHCG